MKERKVSKYSLPVNGYSEQQITVYQYIGCFFYSCNECSTNRNADGILQVTLPLKKILHEGIREEAKKRVSCGRDEECECLKIRKQPEVSHFLKTLKLVIPQIKTIFRKNIKRCPKRKFVWFSYLRHAHSRRIEGKIQRVPFNYKK